MPIWGSLSRAEKLRNTEKEKKYLFNLVHSGKETFFRFIGELTFSPFQTAILLVSKEFSFIYSSPHRLQHSPKPGWEKENQPHGWQAEIWFYFVGFSLLPLPLFSPVLHVLPVLMTTQTLLSRTSHSAWDNSHVLTRQTFVCGWLQNHKFLKLKLQQNLGVLIITVFPKAFVWLPVSIQSEFCVVAFP